MKKIGIFTASWVLFLLSTISFGQEKAEQPAYKDGEFWHYRVARKNVQSSDSSRIDGDYEVRLVNGEPRVYELVAGEKKGEITGQSVDALKRRLGIKDERETLLFPPFVGKKWKTNYRDISGRNTISHSVETEVTGFEEVTTPAGVLRAFKLERVDSGRVSRSYQTHFYSPETRSIIKSSSESKPNQGVSDGMITETVLLKFGAQ